MGNSASASGTDLIGSETLVEDIVFALSQRGCTNLTSSIDPTKCSALPLTGGRFCDLYRGYLKCGTRIAIKCLRIFEGFGEDDKTNRALKRAARELYHWSKLEHPNVLPLIGLAVFRGRVSMISEWMDHGNLMVYLRQNTDADRIQLCMDVCSGLSYAHASRMVHGDLKAANVVVSRQGVAMITDFGNSPVKDLALTLKFTNTNSFSFSLRWAAPELLLADAKPQLTEKTDVYAYGMTALEILTGRVPFEGLNEHQVIRNVAFQRKTPDRGGDDLSDELWEVLNCCWAWDESTRPDITIVERQLNALLPQTPLETIRRNGLTPDSSDTRPRSLLFHPRPQLPPELTKIIFDFYLELIILESKTTIRDFRVRRREYVDAVRGLKLSCRAFAAQVEERMSRIWPHWKARGSCCDPAHIPKDVTYGPETRILIADVCSRCHPQRTDLSGYPNLESVSLGCHNALTYHQFTNTFNLLPLKDVITLPRFLTQLEVLHSHRPMTQIIELAASACPGLTELRIVLCTMFNKPECWWWRRHWQDAEHDYMRDHEYQNVEAYAYEMAESLCALKQLQAVHLGVYMTHIREVMRHRIEHKRYHPTGFKDTFSHVGGLGYHNHLELRTIEGPGFDPLSVALARRELWADPCLMCENELRGQVEDAEQRVAAVLGSRLELLCTVSFPSFLSERRIRPSHWEVQREIKSAPSKKWAVVAKISPGPWYPPGARLRVRTKPLGGRKFTGLSVEFDNFMGNWTTG